MCCQRKKVFVFFCCCLRSKQTNQNIESFPGTRRPCSGNLSEKLHVLVCLDPGLGRAVFSCQSFANVSSAFFFLNRSFVQSSLCPLVGHHHGGNPLSIHQHSTAWPYLCAASTVAGLLAFAVSASGRQSGQVQHHLPDNIDGGHARVGHLRES